MGLFRIGTSLATGGFVSPRSKSAKRTSAARQSVRLQKQQLELQRQQLALLQAKPHKRTIRRASVRKCGARAPA